MVDKKITAYILSDSHEIGKHKADFFKRFGFDISDIETFKNSLIQHSLEREIEHTKNTEYANHHIKQVSGICIFTTHII